MPEGGWGGSGDEGDRRSGTAFERGAGFGGRGNGGWFGGGRGWIGRRVGTVGDNVGRVDGRIGEDRIGVGGGKFELGGDKGEVSGQECVGEDSRRRWRIEIKCCRGETSEVATHSLFPRVDELLLQGGNFFQGDGAERSGGLFAR